MTILTRETAVTLGPVDGARARAQLALIQRSIRAGCYSIVKAMIADFGQGLSASEDSVIREEYFAMRDRALKAFEFEDIHGIGSLIDLSDPMVKNFEIALKKGRKTPISLAQIEAAKRFSSATSEI